MYINSVVQSRYNRAELGGVGCLIGLPPTAAALRSRVLEFVSLAGQDESTKTFETTQAIASRLGA